ncbi:hypothetical protein [Shewanella mangrovi]|uniref:hypothetical protein n=1 Tax=Shewanella mangrovi TaxID=1515746 RepID=UPI000AF4A651|nr:hypothetical protein [Shewanella mangrovi]
MVYGVQNFYYMYYERPNRKAVKANATIAAKAENKPTVSAKNVTVPAFATSNVATC